MAANNRQIFRFGDVELDIAQNCLKRGDAETRLRRQTREVLVYLLERPDQVVTYDELNEAVWQGAAVTRGSQEKCIEEIRRALGDNPRHPRFIKTEPKIGYRFISPVEEWRRDGNGEAAIVETEEITSVEVEIEEDDGVQSSRRIEPPHALLPAPAGPRTISRKFILLSALVALLAAIGTAFIYRRQQPRPASPQTLADVTVPQLPGKKPLAVMFFENQTGGAELDWLREGLADMLITDLSRSKHLTVLSRQQLHLLLERAGHQPPRPLRLDEALDIARRSKAEVVVTGSFAKLGEKVRVDVQLHDARGGQLLGAETINMDEVEQILLQVDLLALKLATRLGAAPTEQEQKAGLADVMTDNLEAYRYYSLALEKARGLHKKDALAMLGKAVTLDPDFAMAHARIGHTYAVTWGRSEEGKPHLEKAFALSGRLTEKDRLYITAWYAIANRDWPAAIESFREIVRQHPTETEAYLRLGYLLRGEEKFEEAISVMRQGLVIDAESSALYNALGLLYSLLGRHAEAIAMHERYVALEPDEPNAHDSLGMSYQWAGRYPEAIAAYRRALELNPNFDIAHVHLGTAHFQTGRYRAAIEWFERYIAVAPSEFERSRGYDHIAHVYRKLRNYPAATRAARQAIKEVESNASELFFLASERGDRATAEKLQARLFAEPISYRGSRNPMRYPFYFSGYIALRDGRADEALEYFREALRHAPATWEIEGREDALANALLEVGRYDEAIAEYERVLRLNPNYPLAHYHLAQAFERKGDGARAREAYQRFLQVWKDADADLPEVVAARRRLSL